jgi:hypothetical protein
MTEMFTGKPVKLGTFVPGYLAETGCAAWLYIYGNIGITDEAAEAFITAELEKRRPK